MTAYSSAFDLASSPFDVATLLDAINTVYKLYTLNVNTHYVIVLDALTTLN